LDELDEKPNHTTMSNLEIERKGYKAKDSFF
jgi:hypothetical protein